MTGIGLNCDFYDLYDCRETSPPAPLQKRGGRLPFGQWGYGGGNTHRSLKPRLFPSFGGVRGGDVIAKRVATKQSRKTIIEDIPLTPFKGGMGNAVPKSPTVGMGDVVPKSPFEGGRGMFLLEVVLKVLKIWLLLIAEG
jgi:hypothetical protein